LVVIMAPHAFADLSISLISWFIVKWRNYRALV
jgi:hypothetical protein